MQIETGIIAHAQDPHGLTVYLHKKAWGHIATDHPEMKDRLEDILQAVKTPTIIETDPTDAASRRYYWLKPVSFGKYSKLYVMVIVRVDKESVIGSIRTAHLIQKPKGGTVLWAKK